MKMVRNTVSTLYHTSYAIIVHMKIYLKQIVCLIFTFNKYYNSVHV